MSNQSVFAKVAETIKGNRGLAAACALELIKADLMSTERCDDIESQIKNLDKYTDAIEDFLNKETK